MLNEYENLKEEEINVKDPHYVKLDCIIRLGLFEFFWDEARMK